MQQLTVSQVCLSFLDFIRALECDNIADVIMLRINSLFKSDISNPKGWVSFILWNGSPGMTVVHK